MLKMLVLKMVKKYVNIHKYKLSLFGRGDTKQAKSLIFIVVPQVEQFPKVQKKKKMLLEPIIVAIINFLNLQVVPDKAFFMFESINVITLFCNLFHFEGPKKQSEF